MLQIIGLFMETPWNRAPSAEIKMSVNAIGGERNWGTLFVLQKLINLANGPPDTLSSDFFINLLRNPCNYEGISPNLEWLKSER